MRVTTVASVMGAITILIPKINEINYYELYSIATSSFTPPHTLTIPLLHSISTTINKTQQLTHTKHLPETTTSDFDD